MELFVNKRIVLMERPGLILEKGDHKLILDLAKLVLEYAELKEILDESIDGFISNH